MKDDRLRVTFEADYVAAVGLAMFTFARLEWDAIWCIEKMAPGEMEKLHPKTASIIADALIKQVKIRALPPAHPFVVAAADFKLLVKTRNAIAHGKPGSDADGGQRLFRDGVPWTIDTLNEASDAFTDCQARLNDILYGYLGHPKT